MLVMQVSQQPAKARDEPATNTQQKPPELLGNTVSPPLAKWNINDEQTVQSSTFVKIAGIAVPWK